MKTRLFIIGLLGFAVVAGAAPAKQYAARISVKGELEKDRSSSSTGNKKTKSETQYYELKVTVANTGKQEGTFDLEWYFLKRPLDALGKKGDPVVCEKNKTSVTIAGMKRVVHPVKSRSLTWSESKTSSNNNSKNSTAPKKSISGAIYGGYVLLLRADGEIVAKYASDKKFLSEQWLGTLQAPVAQASNKKNKKKKRK